MRAVVGRAVLPVVLVACAVLVAGSAGAGVVTQHYDFARPVVKPVGDYHTVSMDGAWSFGAPGEPVLPIVGASLLLPPGERVLGLRVTAGEGVVLGTGYVVEPGQPQYPLSYEGPIEPVAPAYGTRATFPGRLNDESLFGLFRGYGIASVALHPVEYNPADGSLVWFSSMDVEITTEPDDSVADAVRRDIRHDEPTVERVLDMVDNGTDAARYTVVRRAAAVSRSLDPALAYKYIIITTESWDDYLTSFATFQTQRGFKAGIFLKSWIVANYAGVDDAAKIRSFITDAYNTWDSDYVLLVGDARDANGIPHRGLRADGYGEIDNDIPADIYYGALNGTWNTDGDSYWGEPGEEDFYPEVAVGRACVSDAAQAQNFVTKTTRYVNSPIVAECDDALMVGELLWSSPMTYGDTYKNEIRYGSSANGYTTVGFVPGAMAVGTLYDSNGTWAKETLIGLMEGGKNIINHLGHCNVQYSMRMYTTDIPQFDNDGTNHTLNFVYSQGCYCGSFDNRDPDNGYIGDCFAEQFACDDDGAVAAIMNSRYGWGDPGGTDGSSQYFDREFFDAFFNEHIYPIGSANDDSKTDNVWAVNYGANRWCYYETNVFGDPALHVWTDDPTALTVDHPAAIIVGQPDMDFTVSAAGQGAVSGARVTIWTDDYAVYDSDVTSGAGTVTVNPDAAGPGTLHVKVWAHDHLEYNADVTIAPATGPFVVFDHYTIDDDQTGDSNGNGDGIVNAGETIEIVPTLENVGSLTATGVVAVLTSESPYVTITDDEDSYGNIVPLAMASSIGDYAFTISETTPNGSIVGLDLEISEGLRASHPNLSVDEREAWDSGFNVTVTAPVLGYGGHEVDDPMYSGNGNGCLEAGETIQVFLSLSNTGGAAATGVVATLSSTDPYVRINEGERGVASIAAGATEVLDDHFSVTLLPDCPALHEIEFTVNVSADWGCTAATGFAVMSSGGDFIDSVEAGEAEWTHGTVTGGFEDEWHIETYRSHSTGHSWKFGGAGALEYIDSADGALTMRPICLGADAELSFWDWLDAEEDDGGLAWDCCLVEVTTDAGATWSVLEPAGGYSHVKNYNTANPLPEGTPCWSGTHDWRLETFDLSAYSGETVQVRFRFASDGYVTFEGWYVDDIQLTFAATAFVAGDPRPVEFGLDQNRPNPFNPVTTISYSLPSAADVKIEIYNAAGKLVRTLVDVRQEAGEKSALWDGTNDVGQKVASGVYMYRLIADGRVSDKRMVLLK